jgi:hypothetical protein
MMHEVYIHELRGNFRAGMGNKMNERRLSIGCDMPGAIPSEGAVKQIS